MLISWTLFLFLGIFVGLANGLLGIGGGVIIVPTLLFSLSKFGFTEDQIIFVAIKTSLAIILFTGLYASYSHHKKVPLNKKIILEMGIFVLIGGLLGSILSNSISPKMLKLAFMIFVSMVGIKMWVGFKVPQQNSSNKKESILNALAGIFIGVFSSLLGIGGGAISVPYLSWRGTSIGQAVGISTALGFLISLIATITNMTSGLLKDNIFSNYTIGQIYLPAVGGVLLTSLIFTRVGVHFAHKIPQTKLRKVFSILLLIIALKSIFSLYLRVE